MNKFDFIKKLLENEKLNISQKERLIKLVTNELLVSTKLDEQILRDLNLIKDKIGLNYSSSKKYKNPIYLYNFLTDFNQDPVLRYTCHEIDDEDHLNIILEKCNTQSYEYSEHIKVIHKAYNELTYKYYGKNILGNIKSLMGTYLGTYKRHEVWSENIPIKWTSQELESWCEQNKGKVPSPGSDRFQNERFRFTTIELKNGDSITSFSELVIYFKNLFHIKEANPLNTIIENEIFLNFNDDQKYSFEFDDNFSTSIELFTYTETLIQAFRSIVKISAKYHLNDILRIKLFFNYDENQKKELKIVIENSDIFGKDTTGFRLGDQFNLLIDKKINGLCDLYIKAKFNDKNTVGILNVWDGKLIKFIESNDEIEGVEFILKMH